MITETDAPAAVDDPTTSGRGEAVEATSIAPELPSPQRTIKAEATRSDTCAAEGITAHGPSPVLALCRKLIAAGFDPERPLAVWRGSMLALTVESLAQGAGLEISASGIGFRRLREADAASHVPQNGIGGPL